MTQTERTITLDRAIDAIAAERRRQLIRYMLNESGEWVERSDLARNINDGNSEISHVELSLDHHHLPKLADAGIIEYDRRSGAIRATKIIDQIRPILKRCEELEEREF